MGSSGLINPKPQTLNPSKVRATSKPQKPQITSSFPEITHKEAGGFAGVAGVTISLQFFSGPWVSNILGFDIYISMVLNIFEKNIKSGLKFF